MHVSFSLSLELAGIEHIKGTSWVVRITNIQISLHIRTI